VELMWLGGGGGDEDDVPDDDDDDDDGTGADGDGDGASVGGGDLGGGCYGDGGDGGDGGGDGDVDDDDGVQLHTHIKPQIVAKRVSTCCSPGAHVKGLWVVNMCKPFGQASLQTKSNIVAKSVSTFAHTEPFPQVSG